MKNQKHNEIALRVGNYLRRQIKERGLSTSAIAEQLGYSERQIRRWLSGQSSRFDTVEQIAFLFDVSVWDVLADDDEDIPFCLFFINVFISFNVVFQMSTKVL